jgi:hypothetical protein
VPSDTVKAVESQQAQSKASKRATLDLLRSKKKRTREVPFVLNDEEVTFAFASISAKRYDKLLTENPPNTEQRAAGAAYNMNTFAPALLAEVVSDPELTKAQWSEIWESPDWNRGELMTLFSEAVELCNTGLQLGPTATV